MNGRVLNEAHATVVGVGGTLDASLAAFLRGGGGCFGQHVDELLEGGETSEETEGGARGDRGRGAIAGHLELIGLVALLEGLQGFFADVVDGAVIALAVVSQRQLEAGQL